MDARLFEHPMSALITYNEVLRDPNVFLLHLILDVPNIRKQFEPIYDVKRFDCQSENRIRAMLLARDKKNILEWAATKEFDYDFNYKKMFDKFLRMYEDSPALAMYLAVTKLLEAPFVKHLYIYGGLEGDRRVMFDIVQTLGKNPIVEYVTGPYLEVIDAIGEIDLIVDNDIDRLAPVIYMPRYKYSTFLIAKYGYNYEKDKNGRFHLKNDIESYVADKEINLLEFNPFDMEAEAFANG